MDKLFEIQDLCKSFGDKNILKGVSLDIFPQEVVCIIGPSGAGKSTFLRCLNLLERPTNGTILFKNEDILKIKNKLYMNRSSPKALPQHCGKRRRRKGAKLTLN